MTKPTITDYNYDEPPHYEQLIQQCHPLNIKNGFENSQSWKRAQKPTTIIGSQNKIQWRIALPRLNDEIGNDHLVTFFIQSVAGSGESHIMANCTCKSFSFRQMCAHTLFFWWNLCRDNILIYNVSRNVYHQTPPESLSVDLEADHDS